MSWIKIYRSILDDELYFAEKFTKLQAWLDLLLMAEYKPKAIFVRRIKVEIGRGQLAISIRELAERWKWGVNKVQSFLKELEASGKVELLKSHTINIVEICKYEYYQQTMSDTQIDTQTDTQNEAYTDTQETGKTDTQGTPVNKGGLRRNRAKTDTQKNKETDTQIDTQADTQKSGKTDTQAKEKVTKKKNIEEDNKEVSLGGVACAKAPATPAKTSTPKKTKEQIKEETERRRKSFYNSLIPYVETYGKKMVRAFYDYWSELNPSQTKMKWELQKTWELDRRLATWDRKESQYNLKNNGNSTNHSQGSSGASIIDRQRAACADDIAKADELYYKQSGKRGGGGAKTD